MSHLAVPSPDQARQCTKLLKFTRNVVKLVEGCNLCVGNPHYLEYPTVLVALMGLLNPKQGKNVLFLAASALTDFLVPEGVVSKSHLQLFYDEGDKKGATWNGFDKFFWLLSEEEDGDVLYHILRMMDHLCAGYPRVRRENEMLAERLNNELGELEKLLPKLIEFLYNGELRHKYHTLNLVMSRSNCLNWSSEPSLETVPSEDGVAAIDSSGFRSAMVESNVAEALVNLVHTLAVSEEPNAPHMEHVKFVTGTIIYSLSSDEVVREKLFLREHAEDFNTGFGFELKQLESKIQRILQTTIGGEGDELEDETNVLGVDPEEEEDNDIERERAAEKEFQKQESSEVNPKSLERILAICLHFLLHNAEDMGNESGFLSECIGIAENTLKVLTLPEIKGIENLRRMAAHAIEVISTQIEQLHTKLVHQLHVFPALVNQLKLESTDIVCNTIERTLHALVEREGKNIVSLFKEEPGPAPDPPEETLPPRKGKSEAPSDVSTPTPNNALFALFQKDDSSYKVSSPKVHCGVRLLTAVLDEDPLAAAELGKHFVPVLMELLQEWAASQEYHRIGSPEVERMVIGTLYCLNMFIQADNTLLFQVLKFGQVEGGPVLLEFAFRLFGSGCVSESEYISMPEKHEANIIMYSPSLMDVGMFDHVKDISPSAVPEVPWVPNTTELRLILKYLGKNTDNETDPRSSVTPTLDELRTSYPELDELLEGRVSHPWVECGALSMNGRAVALHTLCTVLELSQSRAVRESMEEAATLALTLFLSAESMRVYRQCLSFVQFTAHPDVLCEGLRFLKMVHRCHGARQVIMCHLLDEAAALCPPSEEESDRPSGEALLGDLERFPEVRDRKGAWDLDVHEFISGTIAELLTALLRPMCRDVGGDRRKETAGYALQALRALSHPAGDSHDAAQEVLSQVVMFSIVRRGGLAALLTFDEANTSEAIELVTNLLNLRNASKPVPPPAEEEEGEEESQGPHHRISAAQWSSVLDTTLDLPVYGGMKGCTALVTSILFGHEFVARALLSAGVDINLSDGHGMTPLMAALASGMDSVVLSMLDNPTVNLDKIQEQGSWCALKYALVSPTRLQEGNAQLLQLLLDKGADANISDEKGDHPLHWVCTGLETRVLLEGQEHVISTANADLVACTQHLLAKRALVDVVNCEGKTPLHLAVLNNCPEIVRLYLKHEANPNALDQQGNLALHFVFTGQCDQAEAIAEELLDAGHDRAVETLSFVDRGSGLDKTAKTRLLINHMLDATLAELECPKVLNEIPLSRAELCNIQNDAGLAPVHIACLGAVAVQPGRFHVSKMHDADFPLPGDLDRQSAQVANSVANLVQRKALLLMLMRGRGEEMSSFSSPNQRGVRQITPLMALAIGARGAGPCSSAHKGALMDLCDLLVEAGAKVDAVDTKGLSALHYALLHNSALAWHLVATHSAHSLPVGASIPTLHLSVRKSMDEAGTKVLKYILNQNNMGQVDQLLRASSQRLLQLHPAPPAVAARRKSVSSALNRRKSLEGPSHNFVPEESRDALVDQQSPNVRSSTEVVTRLGLDVRYTGTALMVAAQLGNSQAITTILESDPENVEPNLTRPVDGKSALHLACAAGNLNCVTVLTHHAQLDKHVRDINGETALFDAIRHDQDEVVYYTVELGGTLHDQLPLKNDRGVSAIQFAENRNMRLTDELIALRVAQTGTMNRHKSQQRHRNTYMAVRTGTGSTASTVTHEDKKGTELMEQLARNAVVTKCLLKNCHSRDIAEEESFGLGAGEEVFANLEHADECFKRGQLYSTVHGVSLEPKSTNLNSSLENSEEIELTMSNKLDAVLEPEDGEGLVTNGTINLASVTA